MSDSDFLNTLAKNMSNVCIVGGIARSGTTSLARLLHSIENAICFDECPLLKSSSLAEIMHLTSSALEAERALWEHRGRSYRGFNRTDDKDRISFLLLALLSAFTSSSYFEGKDPEKIDLIACKTPSAEFWFRSLVNAVPFYRFKYIHCVRNPVHVICSNWEMPWTQSDDAEVFIGSVIDHFYASMLAFQEIEATFGSAVILHNEALASNFESVRHTLSEFLCLSIDRIGLAGNKWSDDWPSERRRRVNKLDHNWVVERLQRDEKMLEWCKVFGYELNTSRKSAA
jgi:hypothetical protein